MALLNVDLKNTEQQSFEPLPPGEYEAVISDSEVKQGSKGAYIQWTFDVIGKNKKVWDIMSLGSAIGLQRLKTLAVCAGYRNPNFIPDTEELHGLKCIIKLKIEHSDEFADKNKIVSFKSIIKLAQPQPSQPAKQAQSTNPFTVPPGASQVAPWDKPESGAIPF